MEDHVRITKHTSGNDSETERPRPAPDHEQRLPYKPLSLSIHDGGLTAAQTRPLTTHNWIMRDATVMRFESSMIIAKCIVRGTLQVRWHHVDGKVFDMRSFGGVGTGVDFAEAGDAAFEDALHNMRRCQALDRGEENRCDKASRGTSRETSRGTTEAPC